MSISFFKSFGILESALCIIMFAALKMLHLGNGFWGTLSTVALFIYACAMLQLSMTHNGLVVVGKNTSYKQ